jgi:hypothetical protein
MKRIRIFLVAPLIVMAAPACAASPAAEKPDEGWSAFGHALTLAQIFMRIAAHSENPEQAYDDVLAGRSTEANRAIAGLLEEATADMPPQYRDRVAAIGKDIATVARKQGGKPLPATAGDALQARKDLTAMGLRYYDAQQFLDAVERDDALAVELFIAGRGVNLASKDERGRSALDIARQRGNTQIAELLSRNLRTAR